MPSESQLASLSPVRLKHTSLTALLWPKNVCTHKLVFKSHNETVLSALAVATIFENGWKHTAFTESTCPLKELRHFPTLTSNTLAKWSIEALAKKSPVSWKSTSHTGCVWSLKVWVHEVLTKSHILIVESPLQVTSCKPLGWNLIPLTQSLCPSPDIINSPWGTVIIFQERSSLTVAMMGFFGCSAIAVTAILCGRKVLYNTQDLYS